MNPIGKHGFTLIELLVVTAIVGLVLAAVGNLFISSSEIYTVQDQIVRVQQDVRSVVNMISRDIRMAGYNPTDSAANATFLQANATFVEFGKDDANGGDGVCNVTNEQIDYRFENGEIRKFSQLLMPNVASFGLNYLLADGSTTTSPTAGELDDIRVVSISICGEITGSFAEKYPQNHCFNSTVQCRNMGL